MYRQPIPYSCSEMDLNAKTEPIYKYNKVIESKIIGHCQIWMVCFRWSHPGVGVGLVSSNPYEWMFELFIDAQPQKDI